MNDKPQPNKTYMLIGGTDDKCISNGNTWADSEVKKKKFVCQADDKLVTLKERSQYEGTSNHNATYVSWWSCCI